MPSSTGKKSTSADHRTFKRVSGRSPRLNVTNGPEGPLVTADVLPGVILPGSVGSIGICAPLGPAVPALTVGPEQLVPNTETVIFDLDLVCACVFVGCLWLLVVCVFLCRLCARSVCVSPVGFGPSSSSRSRPCSTAL